MNIEKEQNKKELTYFKQVDARRLIQELYEVIPKLKPTVNENLFEVNMRLFINGNKLILWVSDEIHEELINQVIVNHKLIEDGSEI